MKYLGISLLLVAFGAVLALSAPAFTAEAQGTAPGAVRVVESNARHIVLEASAPELVKTERAIGGATFVELSAAGWSRTDERGKPQMLVYGTLIAVPQNAKVSVRVLRDTPRAEPLAHPVLPVATPRVVQSLDDPLPVFEGSDYIPDSATYSSASLYPAQTVTTTAPANWRSQRFIRVQFTPVQINPAANELTIHDKLRVEIDFGVSANAPEAQLGANVPEGGFEAILEKSLLNYDAGRSWRAPQRPAPSLPPPEHAASTPDSFKLFVTADGMYKVTCESLQAAGLNLAAFTWSTAGFSFMGNKVAIEVSDDGDDHCDNGEFFVFFGQAPTDYAIPYNVYWLSDDGTNVQRMSSVNVTGSSTPASYLRTQHLEENNSYNTFAPFEEDADHWVWRFLNHPLVDIDGNGDFSSMDVTATLDDLVPGSTDGTLTVLVDSGYQGNPYGVVHSRLYSNAAPDPVHEQDWAFGTSLLESASVNNLTSGINTFRIGDVSLVGGGYFYVYLNYVEVEYPAIFTAHSDVLRFKYADNGSWQYQIPGFTTANLAAYDISDPANVARMEVAATQNGSAFDASFGDNVTGAREYYVLETGQFKTPQNIVRDTPSNWRSSAHGADYIIITYGAWASNLQPLVNQRASMGRVVVVDVEDLYDEFNHGIKQAQAIRKFLEYAYASWQEPKPAYVLMVGNGNSDNGGGEQTYIPVNMKLVDPWIGMTATDHRLVNLDGTELPSMAIGRLPALSASDVDNMVSKLVSYETNAPAGAWRKKVMFVTDNAYNTAGQLDGAGNFYNFSEEVAGDPYYFPSPMVADRIYFNPCTDTTSYPWCDISSYAPPYPNSTTAANDVKAGILDGRLIVNYVGHGAITSWADALIKASDASALTRDNSVPKYPFMMPMTCYDGYFHNGASTSIAEALVRQANGGAIGSFAPTGLGVATGHDYLDRGFFQALMQEVKAHVGQATIQAKVKLFAEGGGSLDLMDTFNLLGDPGTLMSLSSEIGCAGKPPVPSLVAPDDASKPPKVVVKLEWTASECATRYKYVVRQDSKKGLKVSKGKTTGTNVKTEALAKGHTYYWSVKACNSFGCAKSEWRTFKVK